MVTPKLRPVVFAMPSDCVDFVRGNAQPTAVTRPEADLVKWDAHRAWFPVLPRPAACVLMFMWTLHGLRLRAAGHNLAVQEAGERLSRICCHKSSDAYTRHSEVLKLRTYLPPVINMHHVIFCFYVRAPTETNRIPERALWHFEPLSCLSPAGRTNQRPRPQSLSRPGRAG